MVSDLGLALLSLKGGSNVVWDHSLFPEALSGLVRKALGPGMAWAVDSLPQIHCRGFFLLSGCPQVEQTPAYLQITPL